MLTGIIYCQNCGAKYTYVKGYKNNSYAICRNKKMYGNMACNSKSIREDILNSAVINSIKDVISKYSNKDYLLKNLDIKTNDNLKNSLIKEKESLILKLNENNSIKFKLYKDKANSVISEKDYALFISNINKDIEIYENKIANINEILENIGNQRTNNIVSVVNNFFYSNNFYRNDILLLIDKIEIDAHDKHPKIKIHFKFNTIL